MKWFERGAFFQRFGLYFLLGLALIVRLVRIAGRGLQYDDAFSFFLSARSLPEIVVGTAADTMPPLYYFLLHFWIELGIWLGLERMAWFLRLLSILFSLAAIYFLYRLILELFDDRAAALLAGLLAAISPFQYYHAQDVRNYALLACAETAYLYFFIRASKKGGGDWQAWLGVGVSGLAAMYTHNVAAFAIVLPDIYLLGKRDWRALGKLLLVQAGIGLLTLPWLFQLPGQLAKIQRAWWLWKPGVIDLLQIPVVWSAGLPLPGIWLVVGVLFGLEILAILILLVLKIRREPGVGFLVFVILGLPFLLGIVSYILKPVFVPRAFILSSLAYAGLAGRAITTGWRNGGGKLLLGGFLAAALIGIPAQAGFESFPRSPFESAASDLAGQLLPGERVVHDNKLSYFPFYFYRPELDSAFVQDEPGSSNDTYAPASQEAMAILPAKDLASAVGDRSGVYFVVFRETIQDYQANGLADHPSLEWFDQRFRLVSHRAYNDLEVYHYARP